MLPLLARKPVLLWDLDENSCRQWKPSSWWSWREWAGERSRLGKVHRRPEHFADGFRYVLCREANTFTDRGAYVHSKYHSKPNLIEKVRLEMTDAWRGKRILREDGASSRTKRASLRHSRPLWNRTASILTLLWALVENVFNRWSPESQDVEGSVKYPTKNGGPMAYNIRFC